jgi:excisionase family DNA binding protein
MSNNEKPHAGAVSNLAYLTKQQSADYLQTSTRYVERMIRSGRLRAYKPTPGLLRVRMSDLERFLSSGATIGAA